MNNIDEQKAQAFIDELKAQWVDKKTAFDQYDVALKSWEFEKAWRLESWIEAWKKSFSSWVESVKEHWASLFTPTSFWDTSLKEEKTEAIAGIWDIVATPFAAIWWAVPEIWETISQLIPDNIKTSVSEWYSWLDEEQKKSVDKTWRASWMLDLLWVTSPVRSAAASAVKWAVNAPIKTTKLAWEASLWLLWKASWTSHEAIKEVFNQATRWWWKDILKVIRWDIVPQNILKNLETSFSKIKDDLKQVYGKWYDKLVNDKRLFDSELDNLKQEFLKTLDKHNINVTDDWLDFSESTVRKSSEWLTELKHTYDDILWWSWNTKLEWLDTLKRRLDSWYKWTKDSWLSDKIHTEYSNKVKDIITSNLPEYKNMMERYSTVKWQLDEITAELWVWWDAKRTTTMKKMFSVFNDNEFIKKEVVDTLEKLSWSNLRWEIAWTFFTEIPPRWWLWLVWAWMIGTMLMNPSFLAAFAALSPRLIWEVAVTLWKSVWWVKDKISILKQFVKWSEKSPINPQIQ